MDIISFLSSSSNFFIKSSSVSRYLIRDSIFFNFVSAVSSIEEGLLNNVDQYFQDLYAPFKNHFLQRPYMYYSTFLKSFVFSLCQSAKDQNPVQ